MSPKTAYLNWRRQPAIGCQFARLIASKPRRSGQVLEVVGAKTSRTLASSIDRRIKRLIADPKAAGAILLFPQIASLEELAKGLLALKGRSGWTVTLGELDHTTEGALVTVGISRSIPFGGSSMASEALVLGPFAIFPPTRRAEIAALEIYVGTPRNLDPKTGQPATKANLAHLDVDLGSSLAFQHMWNLSIAGRLRSLGGQEDGRAKAKVAFVLTKAMAQKIGAVL